MSEQIIPAEQVRFNTSAVQVYSGWGGVRTLRYIGKCFVTGRRLYGHDDGQDDPRGILGEHAASEINAADYNLPAYLPTVNISWMVENDTETRYYRAILKIARHWLKFCKQADKAALLAAIDEWEQDYRKAQQGNY